MCCSTLASFLFFLKPACTQALRQKGCRRVWSIHTFALTSFITRSVKVLLKLQACLEKRKFCWKCGRLISTWSVQQCVCVCVCASCVFVCDREMEEFLSDVVIRSSQSAHIGVLSGHKHTHTLTYTPITRFAMGGKQFPAFYLHWC